MSATTLAAPRGIPGASLPAALSTFLSARNACDFVIAMTERYGENWRIPGAPPLVVLGTEAHFQDLLVRSQCKFGKVLTLRLMVAMPLLLERFLRSFRVALLSAAPRMSHSLPLSLHSTRVRLTARS